MSNHNSSDIKTIEQKAVQDHKDADKARTAVQDVLLQKLVHANRDNHHKKEKNS